MDIIELKAKIESNNISNKPLIFKYAENKYLAYQYAQEIARRRNLEIMYVTSVADIPRDSLMFDSDPFYLYVCDVDKFSENISNDDVDVIIICNKVADNLKVDYIDFPKTLPWQIEDFIKMRLAGLDALQIKWLCDISKYDIYRLDNECKKLEIFTVAEQKIIFDLINNDNGFSDLNTLTIFNFTNAILKKDLSTIQAVLTDLKNIDIEGSGLITIFHKQFKNIIDIQLNPKATAQSLNMTPKQFNAIKYNCGIYTEKQLIDIFTFITDLDRRLKAGEFQFKTDTKLNNSKFVEYITLNILNIALNKD